MHNTPRKPPCKQDAEKGPPAAFWPGILKYASACAKALADRPGASLPRALLDGLFEQPAVFHILVDLQIQLWGGLKILFLAACWRVYDTISLRTLKPLHTI